MSRRLLLLAFLVAGCIDAASAAQQFPVQARLFAGGTSANPTNLNDQMTTLGINEFKTITKYGVEATYAVMSNLDFGIRYQKRNQKNLEKTPTPGQDYFAQIDQDNVLLIARVPFYRNPYMRFDIYGGVGGSNTTFKLKTATQEGELTKREGGDWFASLTTSFGASAAFGYKSFFFVVEGGMETNKVDGFKRTGTVSNNIQTIDLSGGYVTVGLMFDGLTATSK